jgi:hypothetical protein
MKILSLGAMASYPVVMILFARATRFDRDSEALLAVRVGGTLAGIGGLTIDPFVSNALRMRRFYGACDASASGRPSAGAMSAGNWRFRC